MKKKELALKMTVNAGGNAEEVFNKIANTNQNSLTNALDFLTFDHVWGLTTCIDD